MDIQLKTIQARAVQTLLAIAMILPGLRRRYETHLDASTRIPHNLMWSFGLRHVGVLVDLQKGPVVWQDRDA